MTFKKGDKYVGSGQGEAIKWLHAHIDYEGNECLIWPWHKNKITGYGTVSFEGEIWYAHRTMCRLANGLAPSEQHQATHACGNGHLGCVHPKHLSWKTNSQNLLDRREHGTNRRKKYWTNKGALSLEQMAEICALKGKRTRVTIAAMFGISPTHVTVIQKRKLKSQSESFRP